MMIRADSYQQQHKTGSKSHFWNLFYEKNYQQLPHLLWKSDDAFCNKIQTKTML